MKKYLCALLALALCLTAALAEGGAAEPTEAPAAAPAPTTEPTAAPATEPESEPTAEPEVPPEPEAEQPPETEEEPEVEPAGELPQDGPATMEGPGIEGAPLLGAPQEPRTGAAEGYVLVNGEKQTGALAELLAEAGEKTVYVSSAEPVVLSDFSLALLKDVTLLPDPEAFSGEGYAVTLKVGGEEVSPEDIASGETVELIVAVEKKAEPGPGTKPTDPPREGEVALRVEPRNFAGDGVWQCEIPEFALSGIPEGGEGYSYAAIVLDERIIPLSGSSYMPLEEGVYTVRFAILDAAGDVVNGASDPYELWLDYTAPELSIEVSATQDYTMTLGGYDALSGVAELSMDGGSTWTKVELGDGLSVVHSESRRKVFAPGTVGIRDLAGNESWNAEEIVLDAIPKEAPVGFGGYGGGGEPKATAAPHASGDGDDAPYDAYELALPEGPVDALTLGGEVIDLGLELSGEDVAAEGPGRFTAELDSWAAQDPVAPEIQPRDTLVLRAELDAAGTLCDCVWRVNGAVLRKLYNSEIQYLALAAGDAMLALPTVGFTAGTRYAELKMAGVSTAEFEYEITMRIGPDANIDPGMLVDPETGHSAARPWNIAPNCAVTFAVEVAGERFEMIDRAATPEMYPFDVYCGPADLPDYPYGAYPGLEAED